MDNRQVAHEWAHGRDRKYARNNVFASNGTIFSHGHHFPMARFYGLNTVLMTRHGYSVSTSKHLGYVRNAIPSRCKVFYVDKVCGSSYGQELDKAGHLANVADMVNQIANHVEQSKKPRIRQATRDSHLASAEHLRTIANEYRAHFKLGGKPIASIGICADKIDAAKKRDAKAEKLRRLELDRLHAEERKHFAEQFEVWKNGGTPDCSVSRFHDFPVAFRFRPNGHNRIVETSKGAQFSASEGIVAFARMVEIRNGLQPNEVYTVDVNTPADSCLRISGFNVETISAETIVIGCHKVKWATAEELASRIRPALARTLGMGGYTVET